MNTPDYRSIGTDGLPEESFPPVRHDFRIYVSEQAFDRATARGAAELTKEIGGILVGRLLRDAGGPFILVETTIDALHAEEGSTELTFTHDTWAHVHEEMDAHHEGQQILGWYHTHPGFGVFLSDRDIFIQKSFFDLPYQVALVYDPKSKAHGVFRWQEGEAVRCRRYFIGPAEQTFEPVPEQEKPEVTRKVNEEKQPAPEESPLPADRTSLSLIAVILVLLGGLGGYWLGQRGVAEAIDRLQIEALAERAKGAREIVDRIDPQLIGILQQSMSEESLRKTDQALKVMGDGLRAYSKDGADDAARAAGLARIRVGLKMLQEIHELRKHSVAFLTELMLAGSRTRKADPRATQRSLAQHAAALGQLCVELSKGAKGEGDIARARRLLRMALEVDPAQSARYQKLASELGGEGK